MLEEYLYLDRIRLHSYAEQVGVATVTHKLPTWKVGLAFTGPSVAGEQSTSVRSATDHEMANAILDYLRKKRLLLTHRPVNEKEVASFAGQFVLETMTARKVIFVCNTKSKIPGLRELAIWVSNPTEKPSEILRLRQRESEAIGMFVYLIEGYWEEDLQPGNFGGGVSMYTALNSLLNTLKAEGFGNEDLDMWFTSRDDYASPVSILERAGGIKGENRNITALYRVRTISNNQIVDVGGKTIRSYDLFGYPIFIVEASSKS